MNNTPPPIKSSTRSIARKLGWAFLTLFLLVIATFATWRTLLHFDVKKQFAKIRAAGLPTSGAELNTWYPPVPDAENGALVLTQAFALLRTFPDSRSNEVTKAELLARTNVWTPETRSLVEAYVQTNQAALAKTQEGLRSSAFHYSVDLSHGFATLMPHLPGLKKAAFIAALQSAIDAETGDPDKWAENITFQLKLARTLDTEPTLIAYLVRNAIIRAALRATERNLNQVTPGDKTCQNLQRTLTEITQTNLLPRALVGERAMCIPAFRMSWKEIQQLGSMDEVAAPATASQPLSGKPPLSLWLTGFFERDLNFYLKNMDRATSLAALPAPQYLILTNDFVSASKLAKREFYILSTMLLPALSKVPPREASAQVHVDLAQTALAIEQFRHQSNRLPNTLQELTPKFLPTVPLDRFNGEPLKYRPLPRGYIIYSVDADGHDDGGKEPPARKKYPDESTYDLTFIVER